MVCPDTSHAQASVASMLATLARRGPDGQGLETWPGVALGHRRLAIIDLSEAGRQPMVSEDGAVGLVFNGCIYNFLDLRRDLESAGYRFRSRCDTEVILAGYQHWGIDRMVARLRGMFAFAIWDQKIQRLFLVRDRLGVKPLLYAVFPGGIAFGSTLAALQATGAVEPEINAGAVLEFLEYGFVTDRHTIFRGASKLGQASIIEWGRDHFSERRYWELPQSGLSKLSFEDAVEAVEERILDCVKVRLCADVPIAALLSAGIDSTLVCWALAKLNANVTAYTVAMPGDPVDETAGAVSTARALGIAHKVLTIDRREAALDPLCTLVDAFSEPFACQSALGMLALSAEIKPQASVLLTGDGGDDVFLGYPFFRHAWDAQRIARSLPRFAPAIWNAVRTLVPETGALKRARNFLDYATGGIGPFLRARAGTEAMRRRGLLGPRLAGLELPQRRIPASLDSARNLLDDVFTHHQKTHFTAEFMPKVDTSTMHYSLEARAPFLDQELWGFAHQLPPEVHFHSGRLKSVLREIVRRRVGEEAAFRPKQGFQVPAEKWLLSKWKPFLDEMASNSSLERDGWIARGSLKPEIARVAASGRPTDALWYLLVLERWLRKTGASPATA